MIKYKLKSLIQDWEFEHGRHLTLEKLAEKTEIHRTTLSRIAGNAGKKPYNTNTKNIDKLCEFFNCQVGDLMEYVPSPSKDEDSQGKT